MINRNKTEFHAEFLEIISIITVYDNYLADSQLKTGHGFSALVTLENQNILFDTGADSETLLSNMDKMGINPEKIDFIFISHLHHDHTGGLPGILKLKPNLPVYKPESFSSPTQIDNKVWTTGPLGTEIKEQSLVIDSEKGLIIITGCAHPGIVNIIKKAKEIINKKVYLVIGGFHLRDASVFDLKEIIKDFQELGVQRLAPCHCSGDRCRELFKEEYQDNFIENGAGKIINIE
ncbi:MAG: hypothetical protein A2Y82_01530 [Candidatus Buchananbacteria bacterium RBG_13_36_9]|uniref:Metallo-beta-lactamase domain-containing protein n=1 Tax=Candidatus Buchananbacteria bacterium RBG_13_36_9 TaxID=1797530 RepID=A0A1G1XM87_9BACT|nr:MAG: hypothetical protein A2Y82_01530 [Candidatus Buchananbacteria bacterium RBG_13_36_9]